MTETKGSAQNETPAPASLRVGFSWVLVGNTATSASHLVLLSLLAKLAGAEAVGQYTLGVTLSSIVFMLFDLGLRSVQATDARRSYTFSEYLGLRILGVLLSMGVLSAAVVIGGYKRDTQVIVLLVGLQTVLQGLADVFYGLFLQSEQTPRMGVSMTFKAITTTAAAAAILAATRNVAMGCAAMAVMSLLVMGVYDIRLARAILRSEATVVSRRTVWRPSWEGRRLLSLARLSLPLGLTMLINVLNVHISRLVVAHLLGEARLGIFAASAQVTLAGNILLTALGNAASPRLARHFAHGEFGAYQRLFVRLVALAVAIGCGILLIGILGGKPLLTLLFTAEFAKHLDVFLWLMLAAAIHYVSVCFGVALTASRCFKAQLQIGVFTLATTVLATAALVPSMGLLGAAAAAVATASARLVGLSVVFVRVYRRSIRQAALEGAR